ncbi:unnamed protein product [Trifolium pratense]|uniref:Uncharacterized protein n=1 Tax=Trifolium pratense TaxID=57577 RepID=A0ACB0K3J7_TRIPR|nr:unnamed protein product [Trifolium pratense]
MSVGKGYDYSNGHVCWKGDDAYHRKSVAASLVKGVYVLERDRQKQRKGPDSLAFPWWTFFHFQLLDTLVDDVDNSIFGAIYEFKPPPSIGNNALCRSPHYVIAFRGTTIKPESFFRDMKLDLKILRHGLHRTSRSEIATETVRNMVASVGGNGSNICLRIAGSVLTAGLAIAMNSDKKSSSYDSFAALSAWIPCLFVNPSDYICSEYVGYFEHRRKMEEIGAGSIEKIATQNSVGSLIKSAFGKESEPVYLIPSGNLTVNLSPPSQSIMEAHWIHQCLEAHGIHQWWKPDLHLESKLHKYKY